MKKFSKFVFSGGLNTLADILILNFFLWIFPPKDSLLILLIENGLACLIASVQSFYLNKYWTFERKYQKTTKTQLFKFSLVAVWNMLMNTVIFTLFLQFIPVGAPGLSSILAKIGVAASAMSISYLLMSVHVFVYKKEPQKYGGLIPHNLSLSIVLPAYNEEKNIAKTIHAINDTMRKLLNNYEIIVVNDGSKDQTAEIVKALALCDLRLRLISHHKNKGCGAALITGFQNSMKEFVFYMDADGQFDINDIAKMLPLLKEYDGVFGYRYNRQDPFVRKVNAWLWNILVRWTFGLKIKDIDCAFKIFRSSYFKNIELEAHGALLLTEIVYKFLRSGHIYTEVPVEHFPRLQGESTGAKPTVIFKAFRELFFYSSLWHQRESEGVL